MVNYRYTYSPPTPHKHIFSVIIRNLTFKLRFFLAYSYRLHPSVAIIVASLRYTPYQEKFDTLMFEHENDHDKHSLVQRGTNSQQPILPGGISLVYLSKRYAHIQYIFLEILFTFFEKKLKKFLSLLRKYKCIYRKYK